MSFYLPLILLSSVPTHALTTFDTNCTLPYVSYNYVSGPNIRSTLDMTWSSLATIIACTFTVLHLNVPEQRDGRDIGRLGDLKWWWKGIKPTIHWTLTTIIEPEHYALNAIDALHAARRTRAYLRGLNARNPSRHWTLLQAFYINMGGYAIRSQENSKPLQDSSDDRGALNHLGARAFCMLAREGTLELDDLLTDEEITDRAKSDTLAKGLAVVQILYFCTNCIVRTAKQLPLSPLEIGTLGFAFCSVISWGCLFSKPRSVRTAVILQTSVFDLAGRIQPALEDERINYSDAGGRASIPNDLLDAGLARKVVPPIALAFGAIHFVAWNFPFPTIVEQWLWRVCVIVSTVSLPMGYYLGWIPIIGRHVDESNLVSMSRGIYGASRLTLIVVMVRCLFYLPPESFVNTWAANIPHI